MGIPADAVVPPFSPVAAVWRDMKVLIGFHHPAF